MCIVCIVNNLNLLTEIKIYLKTFYFLKKNTKYIQYNKNDECYKE
jgi:hypothetical protein